MKNTLSLIVLTGMLSVASASAFAAAQKSKLDFTNESIASEPGIQFMQGLKTVTPDIYQKIILMNEENKLKFHKDFTVGEVESLFKSGIFK